MYTISVPLMNGNVKRNDRERALQELRRLDAKRVFLALDTYETDGEKRAAVLKELTDNCRFFQENGFEVGAWIWTFWVKNNTAFRNMRSIKGEEIGHIMCPTDENFVAFAADYLCDIARCGVDLIQFDDDFRYGFLADSPACLCDGHIERINGITGETSTREELYNNIVSGGKNKFRDAYLKVNGDAFRSFARTVREAVDTVAPTVRIGACACMSAWDIDGTDAYELARILAGNAKPFVRLIGAPYWAVNKSWGNCLQDVVELERMESAWTRNGDIEIMAEGDAYPRPRTQCPAAFLEGFDTAIRAAGCTDGILKYGMDYTSRVDYETGYARFHERNRGAYGDIDRVFGDKVSCGIRVYESMKKISDMVMPTQVNGQVDIQDLFFSKAARTLACNSIPTVYDGEGVCGIVFDENARTLPLSALKNGTILDIAAAEILADRGVDVGLRKIRSLLKEDGVLYEEHFLKDDNHVSAMGAEIYDIEIDAIAEILSDITVFEGKVPVSYRYENANGERFLVFNLNTRHGELPLLKQYARGRQIADAVPWLSGKKLPAYVYGHPSLYVQTKEKDGRLAVGLWNFYADTAIEPIVELGKTYSKIACIHCDGRLDGDRVYLNDIAPYTFVGFEVE
ncbi:MAG: hypothetical protein E7549_02870 [Ruminococcaceae bacterium]|nr:hypothetical protein [Oscillospiraceae bacterium]